MQTYQRRPRASPVRTLRVFSPIFQIGLKTFSAHLLGLVWAFVTVQNSHVVTQMAIESTFVRAAKALANLHICTGLPKPSSLYKISCVALNGDLCVIQASSEYSGAHLRRQSHWTM